MAGFDGLLLQPAIERVCVNESPADGHGVRVTQDVIIAAGTGLAVLSGDHVGVRAETANYSASCGGARWETAAPTRTATETEPFAASGSDHCQLLTRRENLQV